MNKTGELQNIAKIIIDESTDSINYLLEKTEQCDYQGGIIGPTMGSFFITAILLHETMKNKVWKTKSLLIDFYDSYTPNPNCSKKVDDNKIIACIRHALAHNNFSLNINYLEFWNDYGNLKIQIGTVAKFQNTMFQIYNLNQ